MHDILAQVELDAEQPDRVNVRATLTEFVASHPDDARRLRRALEGRIRQAARAKQ